MEKKIIYLDNASTTSVNADVLSSYNKVVSDYKGNASSIHSLGMEASRLIDKARNQILSCLKLDNDDLIFTSGATEANNLAIKGYAFKYQNRGKHIIVSEIEHPSVKEAAQELHDVFGFDVDYLPVDEHGIVDLSALKTLLRKDTILVSVMAVNNEVGAIQPIKEIKEILKDYPKIAFHVDAVQAIGKVDLDYQDVDMITISSHKIHGLKSIGALIKKKNITLLPLLSGGGQENNQRSGTYDPALIVSFAKAIRLTIESSSNNRLYVKSLYDYLYDYFLKHEDEFKTNSFSKDNPYILNVSLRNKKAAVIVEGLSKEGIMVSSLSACHSKGEKISYVVYAMTKDTDLAHNTLRISLSYENTLDEIKYFIEILEKVMKGVRS